MILDSLHNSAKIESLHPSFKKAFDFIKSTDFSNLPAGKIEIDGDNLFISLAEITGKTPEAAKMETHNQYIDIQLPLTQTETIGWAALEDCKNQEAPYNSENDISFFTDMPTNFIKINPGQFAIFFPEDGHAPGIGEGVMRKLIVKVKVRI
ncbi:MAG: YhcH/YjgK/YiaL family protein [Bacteroidales bacterium]